MAETRELHAALVQGERLLERQVTFFELFDDRLQLGDRRFEVLDGGFGHVGTLSSTQRTRRTQRKFHSTSLTVVSCVSLGVNRYSIALRIPAHPLRESPAPNRRAGRLKRHARRGRDPLSSTRRSRGPGPRAGWAF